MPTLIKHQPWIPGFKVGNACVMPMSAYFAMATTSYERMAAMNVGSVVEGQIKVMMKEAVDYARTKS